MEKELRKRGKKHTSNFMGFLLEIILGRNHFLVKISHTKQHPSDSGIFGDFIWPLASHFWIG